jgi:hypothetical protein
LAIHHATRSLGQPALAPRKGQPERYCWLRRMAPLEPTIQTSLALDPQTLLSE